MIHRAWLALGMAATLIVSLGTVVDLERVRLQGEPMILSLGPADPRSLIQGDYMVLRYRVGRVASGAMEGASVSGELVVADDEGGIARFVRFHQGETLADGERLLDYHLRNDRVSVGTRSWMFEEGSAEVYQRAAFGEFRVLPNGRAELVALRDRHLQPLGEPLAAW